MVLFHRLLAVSGLSMLTSAVVAADTITIPMSTPAAIPLHETEQGFDWSGFYAGVYAGLRTQPDAGSEAGLGIQAGINAQFDFYLLGAEVAVEGLTGDVGTTAHGQILGRAGLVATDDVLVYAAGGYGIDLAEPADDELLLGGGLELALTDEVSLETQYLRSFPFDGGEGDNRITFGANFHF